MKAGERRPPPTPTTSATRAPAPARTTPEPVDPTSPPGPPFLSSYLLFHWPGLHLLCTTVFTSCGHCNDVDGLKRQRPGFPHSSGVWEFKAEVPAGLVPAGGSGESLLPASLPPPGGGRQPPVSLSLWTHHSSLYLTVTWPSLCASLWASVSLLADVCHWI